MRRFLSDMTPQSMARLVLAGLIIAAGLYVLSAFLAPLGWAVVLAIYAVARARGRTAAARNSG